MSADMSVAEIARALLGPDYRPDPTRTPWLELGRHIAGDPQPRVAEWVAAVNAKRKAEAEAKKQAETDSAKQ